MTKQEVLNKIVIFDWHDEVSLKDTVLSDRLNELPDDYDISEESLYLYVRENIVEQVFNELETSIKFKDNK